MESDRASAAWVFEQIAIQEQQHADRSRIRRAVDEAAETWFSRDDGHWWRWIIETSQSLGRTGRVLDGELSQFFQLAGDGVTVILRSDDGRFWHLLMRSRGKHVTLYSLNSSRPVRRISARRLSVLLRREGYGQTVRGVIVEPFLNLSGDGSSESGHKKPLDRMFALLRAESTDIWVVVIFALVSGLLSMTTPLAVEALVNTVAFGRFLQPVVILSLMLFAFLAFQAALQALQTFVVELIQRRMFARVAADLSFRLPRTRIEAFDDHYAPELVNRFFDIVSVQKISAQLLLDGISLVLTAAVGMTILAFYHPFLLAFDVVLVLLMLFTMFVLGRGAIRTSIKESKTKYAMAAWLEDLARCRTAFRYDGAAEFALEKSDQLIFDYLNARRKHFSVLMRQLLFVLLIQAIASTALLAIGGLLVINGQLSLGQLVAAELIVALVVGSFAKAGKHVENFYDLMASIDKLGHLLDLPTERTDGLLSTARGQGLVVRDVNYRMAHGVEVLQGVSMSVPVGTCMAVMGNSGTGKSLLLDLLFGLRKPSSGSIIFNGASSHDLRPDVLRRRIALAREVEIFEGTLAENVHLERPEITISDVRSALEITGLLSLVQKLPQGLETRLLPSGLPLTNGQLRRLMMARAISGRPEVLLIDELLDSLSDEEAAETLRKIRLWQPEQSIVLVTNRRQLCALADDFITLLLSGSQTIVTDEQPDV